MAAKRSRSKRRPQAKKKKSRRKGRDIGSTQTNHPFEQDTKRRIGNFGRTGEPPIMQ